MRRIIAISFVAVTAAAALAQHATDESRDRVVVTGMIPVPDVGEGAPLFTSQELKQLEAEARRTTASSKSDLRTCKREKVREQVTCSRTGTLSAKILAACEIEAGEKVVSLTNLATRATEAAEATRRDAATGQTAMKVVEDAELARQKAVQKLQVARLKLLEAQANMADWQELSLMGHKHIAWIDLDLRAQKRKEAGWGLDVAMPGLPAGLEIRYVHAVQRRDKKGEFVLVSGEILNTGAKPASIPGLSATLLDDRGFPLATASVSSRQRRTKIPAGKTHEFGFEVRPAPQMMKSAVVSFTSEAKPPPRMNIGLFCSS